MAPAYKLTYFDITGLGEPIRFLLKYGNIDFEDNRIQKADWTALKPKTPFGQLPILEHNGKVVGQSAAIARYIAKQVKLIGKNDWEDLEIDATVDTISDLRSKIGQANRAEGEQKEKLREILVNEIMPFYLKRLDAQVEKNNGYFVGGHLTWADVIFAAIAKEDISEYTNLSKLKETVLAIPSIKAWVDVRPSDLAFAK